MESSPFPLITIDDATTIRFAMDQLGLWDDGETIENVERAGQGNMNLVLRVVTDRRRVILKQSRPWVEKYPDIAAPAERILAEIDFYDRVAANENVRSAMPRLVASNTKLHLSAMEDLGEASDYSDLYASRSVEEMPITETTAWLAQLHSIAIAPSEQANIGSHSLRELNHAHMFVIPLEEPAAIALDDVCDGLESIAREVRSNPKIRGIAQELGQRYLGSGPHLLHGDYYPGSWLRTSQGLRVIDPEFAFAGPAEFDLAVLAAHRILIGGAADSIEIVCAAYQESGGIAVDRTLMRGFTALEVIRRLIGVAQLPLSATLDERGAMIQTAQSLLTA